MGFRSVEIDIIQQFIGGKLYISHGNTATGNFDLREAFVAIRDFAFATNDSSPVVISMESHIKNKDGFDYFMKAFKDVFSTKLDSILFYR